MELASASGPASALLQLGEDERKAAEERRRSLEEQQVQLKLEKTEMESLLHAQQEALRSKASHHVLISPLL